MDFIVKFFSSHSRPLAGRTIHYAWNRRLHPHYFLAKEGTSIKKTTSKYSKYLHINNSGD